MIIAIAGLSACKPGPSAQNESPSPSPTWAKIPPSTQPIVARSSDQVIARLAGQPITLREIQNPLIEGYGLNVLLNIVQLDMAKLEAVRAHIIVSPQDISKERDITLAKLFQDAEKSDYDQLFKQFLEQEHISEVEFNLVLETNAYLRKVAEPMVKDKITDAALQEAFRQLYGETVQVRHIQLANLQEVIEAKRRLAGGEAFAKVAQDMSRNARTASLGGELPPFSRQAAGYPQAFKDAAFALKEGEVSDAVQAEGAYHLIELEHRIAPKAVKFEDVKDSLREDLLDRLVQATIKQLRAQIAQDALKELIIDDPVLKAQYDSKLHQRDDQIKDRNQIREQFEKERQQILQRAATQQSATQPTTAPSKTTIPTSSAATQPPAPEVARPPATSRGS
jgi:parvulin-like peptidyl-prolyl isomerase